MKPQDGFTIVEVIVALVMMAVILTSLGGLTYATASQAIFASDATTREAASLETMNRLATLPYADLPSAVGCETIGGKNNQYQRCVTMTTSGSLTRIRIVTTPLQRKASAVTVQLVRTEPPTGNPLCTMC
jgi:prepilin-type N-terminal cleavage/methylation domain-containing protein